MKDKAIKILEQHRLMGIATLRADGWPQATMVSYANEDILVYFMSTFSVPVVRFSSTFIVLLAALLLLQAATARAAPATRIRARIQDSLFIAIWQRSPASQIARTIV